MLRRQTNLSEAIAEKQMVRAQSVKPLAIELYTAQRTIKGLR
jgi:hypothetical protein